MVNFLIVDRVVNFIDHMANHCILRAGSVTTVETIAYHDTNATLSTRSLA